MVCGGVRISMFLVGVFGGFVVVVVVLGLVGFFCRCSGLLCVV